VSRRFLVAIPQKDGGVETYPMKAWLRQHPEHTLLGLDASKATSWELRDGLRKRGWSVNETSTEVRLTPPGATLPERLTDGPLIQDSERKQKMNEERFVEKLVSAVAPHLEPHKVKPKRSLLYELSVDASGNVVMGVDPDSGEPIRGSGHGFEQDILVFDEVKASHTSVIPRIVVEVKFGGVTTHDVLVYAEKADRLRRVYPYLLYGFVLGGLRHIPGRVLRLGQRFDFIVALSSELRPAELNAFCQLMREEAAASVALSGLLFGKGKPTVVQKRLVVRHDDEFLPNG